VEAVWGEVVVCLEESLPRCLQQCSDSNQEEEGEAGGGAILSEEEEKEEAFLFR
jgi:hypothetical protein